MMPVGNRCAHSHSPSCSDRNFPMQSPSHWAVSHSRGCTISQCQHCFTGETPHHGRVEAPKTGAVFTICTCVWEKGQTVNPHQPFAHWPAGCSKVPSNKTQQSQQRYAHQPRALPWNSPMMMHPQRCCCSTRTGRVLLPCSPPLVLPGTTIPERPETGRAGRAKRHTKLQWCA